MSFLLSMWTNLPQLTKDQIIESIVEKFTELFREFYRFYMNSKENSGAKNDWSSKVFRNFKIAKE